MCRLRAPGFAADASPLPSSLPDVRTPVPPGGDAEDRPGTGRHEAETPAAPSRLSPGAGCDAPELAVFAPGFSVFFGTAHRRRVAYAAGYTGLGVCAARFGATVALDLLDGRDSPPTRLGYVRRKPVPFPAEPLRWAVIELTRNRLAAADRRQGRRGMWLRTLDRLGLGFDS